MENILIIKAKNRSRTCGGFSLIELLIVMAILVVVLVISASVFTSLLGPSKREAKIGEVQLESIVGTEMLISDIQHAGFGLPWGPENAIPAYLEAAAAPANGFNDSPNGVPRGLLGNQQAAFGNSSYLVVKATNVGTNAASQRWTEIGVGGTIIGNADSQNVAGDNVIVLKITSIPAEYRFLATGGGGAFGAAFANPFPAAFAPDAATDPNWIPANMAYGVDTGALRMPFNRVDYFVNAAGVPANCAPNTGVLTKNTVNQSGVNGGLLTTIPIIDCVANFQVFYNVGGVYTQNLMAMSAAQIRLVRDVKIFILLHEGRREPEFTYSNFTGAGNSIRLGDAAIGFVDYPIAFNQMNYRWKVIAFTAKPRNL